ncbi:PREDICTED: UDP-glucuronosyltransferase [Papilio xuthus]|uniref:UDP-glucuronosyltransferase n=1 Tax=Papilio xuthus TaxID=66420 RepID=A0AAJ6Z357_PAPXU|nr:PREDICTED: UDP-glucuronosyltransferase [Papilio xuthus]
MSFVKLILLWLCAVLCFLESCLCANILYVVPFTSTSHYIMLRQIGLELARRGHNVTAITANKEKTPPDNYHEVMVDDKKIWEVIGGGRPNVFTMSSISAEKFHDKILWSGGLAFTEVIMNSAPVQKLLASDQKFDLVICEQFFQEAMYILAHKYQAPLALVTTFGNCMRHNIIARNPLQLATVIPEFLDIKHPTSFWGRLRSLYFTVYEFIWWKFWFLEKQEQLVKKYVTNLIEPVPSLYEMQKKASLMLVNSHFSFDGPVAYLPNIVEIGGIHLSKSDGELPDDLKELLDKSSDGVVYMNFGSNVRSSELPLDKKNAFINVFKRLNQTVLWKWEDENLENKPKNLVTRNWLPQKEIFAHPNIKLFISHGGLIGTQEAVFNGIPIIGIPIYADQYNNLLQAVEKGFGKILQYDDINEKYLESIILEVLNNDNYKKKALEISQRFKDRPMTPLDTAMFWLEYLLRNNNVEALKNPALELNWFEYLMLDVYVIVLLFGIIIIYVLHKTMLLIKSVLLSKNVNHDKKKQ